MHHEDHKNGQATGQAEQNPIRYSSTMVMDKLLNTLKHAHDSLRADKMDSTDIITKWSMDEHENKE